MPSQTPNIAALAKRVQNWRAAGPPRESCGDKLELLCLREKIQQAKTLLIRASFDLTNSRTILGPRFGRGNQGARGTLTASKALVTKGELRLYSTGS